MEDDILSRIQMDTAAALRATPGLALAKHHLDNEGDLEATIERSLATLDDESGRMGLALLVIAPSLEDVDQNLPGPQMVALQTVQVIEHALLNRDPLQGTGIRASLAALRVLRALHLHAAGSRAWYAEKPPILPLTVKPGFLSYVVRLRIPLSLPAPSKPAAVHPEVDGDGRITLSCATPGAAIWWTADGSHPSPFSPGAVRYDGPIGPFESTRPLRCAAHAPDMQAPGDVLEFNYIVED